MSPLRDAQTVGIAGFGIGETAFRAEPRELFLAYVKQRAELRGRQHCNLERNRHSQPRLGVVDSCSSKACLRGTPQR